MNIYLEIAILLLPSIMICIIVYMMLGKFFKSENNRHNYELKLKLNSEIIPNRLQAYERLVLFLERIKPVFLVRQISNDGDANTYTYVLVETIQKEFEYNLSQQLYIRPKSWMIVQAAKNATINFVKECRNSLPKDATAKEMEEAILIKTQEIDLPSDSAILYLQKDIQAEV